MRMIGSLTMLVGFVLAIAGGFVAWRGEGTRVNGVSLGDFSAPALIVFALGILLTVAGARLRRKANAARRDGMRA